MYRIGKEEIAEITKVINSRQLFRNGDPNNGHLQECVQFEQEWAAKIGTEHALLLSGGGTAGLICSLVGLGIGPGDEVIVPGYTFMATAVAPLAVGAIPVIAEVNETLTIDPMDVERKITPNTRAIIPVHMMGIPCDMDSLCRIAKKHNIKILEDCCQADGGSYKGKRLGSWGDAGAYSFNDFKIIGCGDGGALVTSDDEVYERALIYHDSGITFRPVAKGLSIPLFAGLQFRASEIMGALMRMQLNRLDGILTDLRHIRRIFIKELGGCPGIRLAPSNDTEGNCGVAVAFLFDSEKDARTFASAPDVCGWLPIDSGRHVYCNWEPIMEKRAGAHDFINPYNLPQNQNLQMEYSKDMCPKTLDLLSRSVFIGLEPDWTDDIIMARIEACKQAGKAL